LLVFNGDTGDEMKFFLKREVSDFGIYSIGGKKP
jgi:hypothetical protein